MTQHRHSKPPRSRRVGQQAQRGRQKRNVTSRKGFTKLMAGGPPAHAEAVKTAQRAVRIADRQHRAWKLFVAGATFEQIGDQLGVSNAQAWRDCVAFKEQLPLQGLKEAAVLTQRQLARLDGVHRTHWPNRADRQSAQVLLDVYKREARLLGLDAPVKMTATDLTGTRPYGSETDEQLQARLRALLAEAGTEALPILDVAIVSGDGREPGKE